MDDSPETESVRDDATLDMGLDPAPQQAARDYQVLARKYRPASFEDMIGQDAMVRTLRNAFGAGRIAHAYMLTGVRGIGKTTTARLLARALNYETDEVHEPQIDLHPPGRHCEAIMTSRHPDVIEMDAASHTGVDEMRELLDGVRYAPVQARYKVYIVDEVHMLSGHSFNDMLKTLEEPPPHVKFVFATTEIRKVPVTVLSRCQRFDLKRVDSPTLVAHLQGVCGKENANVGEDGLRLIARAAEGSVRDALSLLDQAIVQADEGQEVDAAAVRDMLGLADRARVLDLFEAAARGDAAAASKEIHEQYSYGADPLTILRDMLDYSHELSRAAALGDEADFDAAPDHAARLKDLAGKLSQGQLSRIWQVLLKGHEEARIAPDPLAAAEMTILRLAVAAGLPSPEEAARRLAGEASGASAPPPPPPSGSGGAEARGSETRSGQTSGGGDQPVARLQMQPEEVDDGNDLPPAPNTLAEAVELIGEARDLHLKFDIERCAKPISFQPGKVVFQPIEGAPYDLAQRMSRKLQELTGRAWVVVADKDAEGGDTLGEIRKRREKAERDAALASPAAQTLLGAFPDARLVAIRPRTNVLTAPFGENRENKDGEDR